MNTASTAQPQRNGTHLEIDLTKFSHGLETMRREGFDLEYLGRDMAVYIRELVTSKRATEIKYEHHPITGEITSARLNLADIATREAVEKHVREIGAYSGPISEQPA